MEGHANMQVKVCRGHCTLFFWQLQLFTVDVYSFCLLMKLECNRRVGGLQRNHYDNLPDVEGPANIQVKLCRGHCTLFLAFVLKAIHTAAVHCRCLFFLPPREA